MEGTDWLDDAIKKVKAAGAKRIFVQVPEGLKMQLQGIGEAIDKTGIVAVLSCEPCYGACDLRDTEAKRLGCELLLHIGHADIGTKTEIPVIYAEYRLNADPVTILKNGIYKIEKFKRFGLLTTVQYMGSFGETQKFLESMGKTVLVGKASKAKYPGQILGCDQSAAKFVEKDVDAFVFFGTGRFHALGLVEAVNKPVIFLDLESKTLTDITGERERLQRIRFANTEKAKECKNFGILISTKSGQSVLSVAMAAKKKLELKGKNAWLLAMDTITPEKMLGLKLDCLVNCSCPRMTEDSSQFKKPIINPEVIDSL